MTSISDAETRTDAYLGGRVRVRQGARGYRAGVDAVMLAAAVPAEPGETVLELGCGVGVAALCLAARVPGLEVTGVELHPESAGLARENGLQVVTADLRDLPPEVKSRRYDHVMMNPPYFDRRAGKASPHAARDLAHGGDTALADWLEAGTRRLAPGGRLTLIQRIARLPEVLGALRPGTVRVRPLVARQGREADRFLLTARQGGRGAFRLLPPFVLHAGPMHLGDEDDDYTAETRAILRDGAAFPWGD